MGLETLRVDSPFEAFVSFVAYCLPMTFLTLLVEKHFTKMHRTSTCPTPKAVKLATKTYRVELTTVKSPRQRKHNFSDDEAICETKQTVLNIQRC